MVQLFRGGIGFVLGAFVGLMLAACLGLYFIGEFVRDAVIYDFCGNAVSGDRYIFDDAARRRSCAGTVWVEE